MMLGKLSYETTHFTDGSTTKVVNNLSATEQLDHLYLESVRALGL